MRTFLEKIQFSETLPRGLSCPRQTDKGEKSDDSKWKGDKNVAK